jgi:uncharacterized membrane protein YccC
MESSAHLRPWRLLPAYAINGITVALGVGCIQFAFSLAAGSHAAQLVISGAVCASIADVPNTVPGTWHRVSAAATLSFCAALVVVLLKPYPLALGIGIALIAFIAMMTMAWGARAGAVSFAPILSLIFSMAVPASGQPLAVAGWNACGGLAYLAWSLGAGALCQRRYRSLVLGETLRAAAQLFRSRAGVLASMRPDSGDAEPMRAWIRGEATLAERLQSARNLLFTAADGPRWRRDTAMLLRVIDLRDVLLASRLDIDRLGGDATGRSILDHVAGALRQIGDQLDCAADELRDNTAPFADTEPRFDFDPLFADVPMLPNDPRARLLPALLSRLRQLADDVVRIHRLLQGDQEALPLTRAQLHLFIAAEGWPLRALRPQLRRDSLVLRHAVRTGLALGSAYFLALTLPWASHPYWLVLSVAVVLRGNLEQTLARRNARVLGTILGCLLVVGLSHVQSPSSLSAVFLAAVGVAHAFVMQRYWLTATSATVMALLQSHMVNPRGGFSIAERVADTLLGALLAWSFSFVLPSWERRALPGAIARVLRDLRDYATHALRLQPGDAVELRLARRRAYDTLGSLADALQRSSVEPKSVRLPVREVATLLDHGECLMAHLSMVRLILAELNAEADAPLVDSALAEAHLALSACLDLQAPAVRRDKGISPEALALLPAQPPEHNLIPWLSRRLLLMVHEADRIRHAAASALAAQVLHYDQRHR